MAHLVGSQSLASDYSIRQGVNVMVVKMLKHFGLLKSLLLLTTATLLLGSCTQSSEQALSDSPDQQQALTAQLNQTLPSIASLRSTSAEVSFTKAGNLAFTRSGNALDEGEALRLSSTASEISWGIWLLNNQFNGTSVKVHYSEDSGEQVYYALANYQTHRWNIGGTLSQLESAISVDPLLNMNTANNIVIALIATGGSSPLIDELELIADVPTFTAEFEDCGGDNSLIVAYNRPAISYFDNVADALRYTYANDVFGMDWFTPPLILDASSVTGLYNSLAIVDSYPAIAYHDAEGKRLRYIRAMDFVGGEWNPPVTVDDSSATGEWCSLAVVSGNPAISYYDIDNSELRYVRSIDQVGAEWGMPVSVDNTDNTGQETFLTVVNGLPMISYRNGGAGELRVIAAIDDIGSAWGAPKILSDGNNTGFSSSMAITDGIPALAYYDGSDSSLLFQRASDVAGNVWGDPLTLDGLADDAGSYPSLFVINGLPGIAYYKGIEGDLRYVQALDSAGSSWSEPQVLDDTSVNTGQYCSLFEIQGHGAVSYYDQTHDSLRYIWGFGG